MKLTTGLKRAIPVVHDIVMAAAALYVALLLRYGLDDMPPGDVVAIALGCFGLFAVIASWLAGLSRGIWRFTSISDLRAVVVASTVTVGGFLLAMFLISRLEFIPRSVPLIAWFVLIVLLGAPRIIYRVFRGGGPGGAGRVLFGGTRAKGEGLLIVGAASDAERVARTLGLDRDDREFDAVGIVDVSPGTTGLNVRGVPILGSVADLEAILGRLDRSGRPPQALVVAAPREHSAALRDVAAIAAKANLPVKRLAGANGVVEGAGSLKPVTIEDLLGRPPVSLDLASVRALVGGKTVLVTGAGGSIGSELVRQVASLGPGRLVLLDNSEFNLYQIDRMVASSAPTLDRLATIGSVQDRDRIHRLFVRERPDVVFHAAALKHVPLVEENACEGVLTNIAGTRNVADAAIAAGARAMVVISTDKAIRPSSVMGATKKIAEAYCQALDVQSSPTRFITVRFGNVLGSTGSVVPLFEEQIRRGGPVTVTHPEMQRYFMTIREATELVLQAAAHGLAHPEEAGSIHVLDMGEPVRIVDLARTMISLAGLKPETDIQIQFTGARPGEKLFEEYFGSEEQATTGVAPGVLLASPRLIDRRRLEAAFDQLFAAATMGRADLVRGILREILPDSTGAEPDESGRDGDAARPPSLESVATA